MLTGRVLSTSCGPDGCSRFLFSSCGDLDVCGEISEVGSWVIGLVCIVESMGGLYILD